MTAPATTATTPYTSDTDREDRNVNTVTIIESQR